MRTGTPQPVAIAALAALAVIGLLLGGCGPRETAVPAQPSSPPPASPAAVPEPAGSPPVEPPAAPDASPTPPTAPQQSRSSAAIPALAVKAAPTPQPATESPALESPAPAAGAIPPAPGAKGVVDPGGEIGVPATRPGLTRVGAGKCRVCHKLQYASWSETAHAKRQPPLECESCHGPGSEYKSLAVMKDVERAKAAGLVLPTATFCATCHRQDWSDDQLWKAHAHKRPPGP